MPTKPNEKSALVFRSGFLLVDDGTTTVHCIVTNLTPAEAVLTVRRPESIPDMFVLVVDQSRRFDCLVTGRVGTDLRVAIAPIPE
jgi:hypothetical protein